MTKIIIYSELKLLSFPDAQVLEMTADIANKTFSLTLDRAYFDSKHKINIDGGTLVLNNWEHFSSKLYSLEGSWNFDFDELKDICEFIVSDTQVMLKGFGKKTGNWTEYVFLKVQAYFYINH